MPGWGPAQRVVAGLGVMTLGALGFAAGRVALKPNREVVQPIAFNHKVHGDVIECEGCHELVKKAAHSGLPPLATCMQCHEKPLTEKAEEKKISAMAAAGQEVVFRKLFRLPGHVFYTHRRHVGIAKLDCATCHGAIAKTETPPREPLQRITMSFCVSCHVKTGITTACTACHR
jgi:menaquinone reductase, multiheme cytochrome c subunit